MILFEVSNCYVIDREYDGFQDETMFITTRNDTKVKCGKINYNGKEYDSGKYIKDGGLFEVVEKPYLFPFIFTIKDIPYEFNISYRYLVIIDVNTRAIKEFSTPKHYRLEFNENKFLITNL